MLGRQRLHVKNLSRVDRLNVEGSSCSRGAQTERYRCTCRAKNGMSIFSNALLLMFSPLCSLSLIRSASLSRRNGKKKLQGHCKHGKQGTKPLSRPWLSAGTDPELLLLTPAVYSSQKEKQFQYSMWSILNDAVVVFMWKYACSTLAAANNLNTCHRSLFFLLVRAAFLQRVLKNSKKVQKKLKRWEMQNER